jgi:ACS family hexuronate transporter-like MFS transporter
MSALLCVDGKLLTAMTAIHRDLMTDMSPTLAGTDADSGGSLRHAKRAARARVRSPLAGRPARGWRLSMLVGVSTWSLAAIAHGWAISAWHVVAARVGLGATEAVQTPLTIKTVATLFPPNQRSFAFGVGTAIAGTGTLALPFFIPVLAAQFGWRGALIFGGVAGFLTLGLWLWFARGITFNDGAEDEHRDFSDDGAPYGPILKDRRTWAIVVAKALSDATWWLINFWLPDFYRKTYGLTTEELAFPLAIAFLGSGGGALFAGWVSTRLLERGWSVNLVRKTVMLTSALVVLPLPLVLQLNSFWPVAVMMGVVMAGHQGFSLSIFSTITDVVPRSKVGRVTAFGAFMGNMGGAAIQLVTGAVLTAGLGYTPLFLFAAFSYLLALLWLHLLLPTIRRSGEPVQVLPLPT